MKLRPVRSAFEVSYAVPIPKDRRGGYNAKYPWHTMEVGGSFFVPGGKRHLFDLCSRMSETTGWRYMAREVEEEGVAGVRVWRKE
jgi:hypothetical protein